MLSSSVLGSSVVQKRSAMFIRLRPHNSLNAKGNYTHLAVTYACSSLVYRVQLDLILNLAAVAAAGESV